MEVVVCENQREAREHFRQDRDENQGVALTTNAGSMTLQLHDGTTRRYYSAQDGVERLMGLEIDGYYNLIRDNEQYWQFEDFLRVRVQRSEIWQRLREERGREEASVWTQIKEQWKIFLSRPVGRLMLLFTVLLVVMVILVTIQQIFISP